MLAVNYSWATRIGELTNITVHKDRYLGIKNHSISKGRATLQPAVKIKIKKV